ncbi:MAG: lasso peptide biosynthesis protein, partial [Wenzhouxiangella sp.]|nr:lasso peptide biosynthesis protein [Wenzhouxiangella sp.]
MSALLPRYRALPVEERRELLPAAWRLLLIRFSLLGSIEGTRQRFSGRKRCERTLTDPEERLVWERRATALRRVGSRLPGVHCLARSLALRWWMRSQGIAAVMIMGARR